MILNTYQQPRYFMEVSYWNLDEYFIVSSKILMKAAKSFDSRSKISVRKFYSVVVYRYKRYNMDCTKVHCPNDGLECHCWLIQVQYVGALRFSLAPVILLTIYRLLSKLAHFPVPYSIDLNLSLKYHSIEFLIYEYIVVATSVLTSLHLNIRILSQQFKSTLECSLDMTLNLKEFFVFNYLMIQNNFESSTSCKHWIIRSETFKVLILNSDIDQE